MSRIIKSLDLFGDNMKIYFNQQEKIKTFFGGYLSLIIISITLAMVWFVGKDIIYKVNPFNYQQQIANKKYLNNTITKMSFPFAFSLENYEGVHLDQTTLTRYLQYEFNYVTFNYDDEGNFINNTIEHIKLGKCDYEDFPSLTREDFDALVSIYDCPKFKSRSILGSFSETQISYLSITVKICNYDIPENNCYSYNEIMDYINNNGLNMEFAVLEPQIVINNYAEPVQKYVKTPYKFLTDIYKIIDFNIELNEIRTDAGILFESSTTEEFLRMKEAQTDIVGFDKKKKIILEYNFYSSNLQTIYVRKYIKVPEILASIGGLYKLFTLVGYFINLTFSRISKNLTTISCLFLVESDHTERMNLNVKSMNTEKVINSNMKSIQPLRFNNYVKENITDGTNTLEYKIKARKSAELTLSVSEYFQLICRKNKNITKQVNLYNKAMTRIKDYFDIIFIINKLIEVEIIKEIFLTENQRIVLENIKPVLSEDNNKNMTNSKIEFNKILTKFLNSQNSSDIDNKLIQIISTFH